MRRWIATAAVMATIQLFGPGSASAFTEVGNNCTATIPIFALANTTAFQAELNDEQLLPLTVTSPGVVTKWKVNITNDAVGESVGTQKLVVLQRSGEFVSVRGESAFEEVTGGPNVFETRIPVGPGDRFGIYSSSAHPACSGTPADIILGFSGSAAVGSTVHLSGGLMGYILPFTAIVEPDADGDGYGDETQDRCPSDPGAQGACPSALPPPLRPPFALDSYAIAQGGRAVLVLVSTSSAANVSVAATVRTPGTARRGARRSALLRLRGPSRSVAAGELARLPLRLSGPLLAALRKLPRGRSLALNIVVTGRDELGQTIDDRATVRLRGRAKPRRSRR